MADRIAFLIGNQTFRPDSGLLQLQGPANDVAALARLLRDPERGNFEVHEFLDKPHHEVLPELDQALGSAAVGDLLLIYYSGHGKLARNGHLCLATADTRQSAVRATSIPARYLRDLVEESDCDQVVLLLDCCYSDAVDDGLRGDPASELQVVENAHGFYIITASTGLQTARETALSSDVIMGQFTAALVNGIESGAADRARKGKILLSDLRYYLGQVGIGSTPQFFDSKASGDPLISLSPATALPLHPVSARIDFLVNHVLKSSVHSERVYALQKLHDMGPDAAEAVPILIRVLQDPNAELLQEIGPAAADAVPTLAESLKDATLRWRAAVALQRIGSAAVPALAEALKDQSAHVRTLAEPVKPA
jgi:hypothetical protein